MSDSEQKSITPELRNRIVGSVILLIAAIVILPSIIGPDKVPLKEDFKKVPAKAEFEVVAKDKPFPQDTFKQNMPSKTAPVDEEPVDALPNDTSASVASNEPVAPTVETETLTVSPMSKPQSFLTPQQLAAQKRAEQAQAPVKQEQKQEQSDGDNVVHNTGNSDVQGQSNKSSPFTTQAWVIQLGSFGNKANANAIEKKLNKAGFTTFSRQIQSTRGTLTKVYVGPELDKSVLQQSLVRVNKVANVKGLVTSFTIKR